MRDTVTRSVPFDVTRTDSDDDGLTLEGYAAVFNTPTRIDSWEGRFDETIAPGAFAKTIREQTPVLQFDHGQHPMLGSIPLGSVKHLREDDHGLFVRARITDNWLTQPVRDAIADGAITGMSFRFSVTRDEWDDDDRDVPQRTLREVKLYELGPVVFPAYDATSVGVRSVVDPILADPDKRRELAATLTFGSTEDLRTAEPACECTSDDATDDPAPEATRRNRKADIAKAMRGIDIYLLERR